MDHLVKVGSTDINALANQRKENYRMLTSVDEEPEEQCSYDSKRPFG